MISIVECKTKPLESVKDSMLKMFKQLNYSPEKSQVLLKPNIVDATSPRNAVTTDPQVIAGIILALHDMGIKEFVIGENSGYYSFKPEHFDRLLKDSKYQKMVDKLKSKYGIEVEIQNLEFVEFDDYNWKYGKIKLPKICKTHSFINVAKMKTHYMTGVTLCAKNMKGILTLHDKKEFHLGYKGKGDLHDCIYEYSKLIQPEFNIVDATTALEGTGPARISIEQTNVRKLNLCIGGRDMIEVDNACCKIMGVPIEDVKHLPKKEFILASDSLPLIPADPPFQKPDKYIRTFNINLRTSIYGCTNCQMSFSRMMRKISFVPEYTEQFTALQKKHPVIDLFIGKIDPASIPEEHGTLVFFGSCTKEIAEKIGAVHIPGCPADYNKGIEKILNL